MPTRHPTDPLIADLLSVYEAAQTRIRLHLEDALRRGLDPLRAGTPEAHAGDASAAYRARQLAAIQQTITSLHAGAAPRASTAVQRAYLASIRTIDELTGKPVAFKLGAAHARAVAVLSANLDRSLQLAATIAGKRVADVFDVVGQVASGRRVGFVGRRANDAYRAATLRAAAEGLAAAETRAEISGALVSRLIREGVTDALTGFVDGSGRRWPLDAYARMAIRTTTRESVSVAARGRMLENGVGMVTISDHASPADECSIWAGQTFPIDEVEWPPYHPNCIHVATPAAASLDVYESTLDARLSDLGAV